MRQSDLFMDSSILHRSTQKYFDRILQDFHLTYAHLPVLIMVYENEGLSLQDIAAQGVYDKGTITKNVQKLESLGYLIVKPSTKDKRARELYTTSLAKTIMIDIYSMRNEWWKHITSNIPDDQLDLFSSLFVNMTDSAKHFAQKGEKKIQFYEHQKVNLKTYPDHIATVLYTGGCNFHCDHCLKKELVYLKENKVELPLQEIENYLEKRKKTIQAVCIKGGEPCMHAELTSFLVYAKSLGYKTLIQTNGSYPEQLIDWIEDGLIDRVSLTISQSKTKYSNAIGIQNYNLNKIEQTISYLIQNDIDFVYETTLWKEEHSLEDIIQIAKWLQSDIPYELYCHDIESEVVEKWLMRIRKYMPNARIGGSV